MEPTFGEKLDLSAHREPFQFYNSGYKHFCTNSLELNYSHYAIPIWRLGYVGGESANCCSWAN